MSLLRRRMMMQEQAENKKKLYLYNGYIGSTSTAFSEPEISSTYPNAVCSSAIFLYSGDNINFQAVAKARAMRRYNSDAQYIGTAYSWNFTAGSDFYIRLLANDGIESFEKLTITRKNGIVDEYEIIDRR